jgi:hypothetical protein
MLPAPADGAQGTWTQMLIRYARGEGVILDGDFADFAAERDLVLVFVLKKNVPAGGGQAATLARVLDRWDTDHPDPYLGRHWPTVD